MHVLIAEWQDTDYQALYFDGERRWSGDTLYLDEIMQVLLDSREVVESIEQKRYDLSDKWSFWRNDFPVTSGELFGFEVE